MQVKETLSFQIVVFGLVEENCSDFRSACLLQEGLKTDQNKQIYTYYRLLCCETGGNGGLKSRKDSRAGRKILQTFSEHSWIELV